MPSPVPLLDLRNLAKAYGPIPVLEGVGFTLWPGEVRCLAGENGSGKSTLIKILSGVIAADAGEVLFDGKRAPKGARAAIAMAFR
ncbi:ATP-binding cassette domain-containing protein [Gemmobacter sp. 24YEA27]|uniref:ATP-binding cassette domain-containing protein n=1 Tax=Gemmobacter sp. 24YEA27 TaxID=3040672 RepID=UPI0024B38C67|nr:ATP-binding cassette domain-containing protein [Gemmobacter sp. 24YEA27]